MRAIYLLPFVLASVLAMPNPHHVVAPPAATFGASVPAAVGAAQFINPLSSPHWYSNLAPSGPGWYSNLHNLNIPAAIPAGDAPPFDVLVQRIPVQGLGRPVITHTPQITEVRPQLKITDVTIDVPVPKPVYKTQEVTPVHHQYVAEPYPVHQPYAVPQPYPVPTPVGVPVAVPHPVHVQHNVIAPHAVTYGAPIPAFAHAFAPAVGAVQTIAV